MERIRRLLKKQPVPPTRDQLYEMGLHLLAKEDEALKRRGAQLIHKAAAAGHNDSLYRCESQIVFQSVLRALCHARESSAATVLAQGKYLEISRSLMLNPLCHRHKKNGKRCVFVGCFTVTFLVGR